MAHFIDYCACANMDDNCPNDCFRKQVSLDIIELAKKTGESVYHSISYFKGTDECPLTPNIPTEKHGIS